MMENSFLDHVILIDSGLVLREALLDWKSIMLPKIRPVS